MALLLCLPLVSLLIWQAWAFVPYFADDGFISMRYAERFVHGRGLTWTDGERVEGYSNLLWVVATGVVGRLLRDDFVLGARICGVAGMAVAAGAGVWFGRRSWPRVCGAVIAGALVASTPIVDVWAIGGLEQPFVAGLLMLGLSSLAAGPPDSAANCSQSRDALRLAAWCFGLLCLTRPDGVLFVAVVVAVLSLQAERAPGRRAALLRVASFALPAVGLVLGQLVFRWLYYRDWVPNTAYAKVAFTMKRAGEGWGYLVAASKCAPLVLVGPLCALPLFFSSGRRRRLAPALAVHVAWSLYIVSMGGDIFPAYRHAVPLVVTSAWLLGEVLVFVFQAASSLRRLSRTVALSSSAALALSAAAGLSMLSHRPDPEVTLAREERWPWAGEPLGLFMKRGFGRADPLVAVDPAGGIPYFSKLRALDMLGLNDRYLAHHRPANFGSGVLAHELGDGLYVHARKPDLVVFCMPWGRGEPCFRGGYELLAVPTFHADYTLAEIQAEAPREQRGLVWVRREGPLGVTRSERLVRVPAILLASEANGPALLGPGDRVELRPPRGRIIRYQGLPLPTGRWRLVAERPEGILDPEGCMVQVSKPATSSTPSNEVFLPERTVVDLAFEVRTSGPLTALSLVQP